MTPHAGELSRIINISAKEIEDDRIQACRVFSNTEPAVILLKGHKTVIHSMEKYYIICSGNKALAKAGTGDVLAGIISSFFAQGLDIEKAACLGAYIHGDIADQWVRDGNNVNSLMASDLVEGLKNYQPDKRSITDK